ncbi:MAG TPA: GDP-mannose 4,6-dehydratase [Patescibacteria group bacterium]|nr:GDP-mannose 4,6-dehydratase [Patescibacteria group bacterium]
MSKTAFITGITGQDGSYLAELLLSKGYRVFGLVSNKYNIGFDNLAAVKDKVELLQGDLLDQKSLAKALQTAKPDEIYNLAGLTFVPASWDDPSLVFAINAWGVSHLLMLIRNLLPQSKFYQATSAKIFGRPVVSPQTEETPLNPVDPYSVSKAAAHYLVRGFREHFKLFAVSGILYNHESERRGEEFVTRKITLAAAKIKKGLAKELSLGDLSARQDWGYAPDYVEAMWLMLQAQTAADYIIATGQLHSVEEVCQIAFEHLGLNFKDYVKVDKSLFRPSEAKEPVGDAGKAKNELNWQPKTSFRQMIIKMVEHDLQLIKS